MQYKKSKVWLYKVFKDHIFHTDIKGRDFENEWMKITPDGKITVKGSHPGGFAWDGCSPKWIVFDLVLGSPDGVVNPLTLKPKTYYASMVHDVVYQIGTINGITRKEADILLLKLLRDFKLRYLYYFISRTLGWYYFGR